MAQRFDVSAIVDDENRDYHRFLKKREFRLQRCSRCGYLRPPASRECPECLSEDFAWEELRGGATVQTFIWYFEDVLDGRYTSAWAYRDVPYNVAIVKLDEGPQLLTNVEGTSFGVLRAGQRVVPVFVDIDEEYGILRFAPLGPDQGEAGPAPG